MSATNSLENGENLEEKIVALVRMEDIQPDRSVEVISKPDTETVESNDCILNEDEDSNIGSMVSIKSEEVIDWQDEDSDSSELIVPDADPLQLIEDQSKAKESDRWPTLEILPGGVIKNADKYENDLLACQLKDKNKNDVGMYVCAKCSESFDNLILLVKHVRGHEEVKKKDQNMNQHSSQSKRNVPVQNCKRKLIIDLKTNCKVPKKG